MRSPTSENARRTSIRRPPRSPSQTRRAVASRPQARVTEQQDKDPPSPRRGRQLAELLVSQEDVVASLDPRQTQAASRLRPTVDPVPTPMGPAPIEEDGATAGSALGRGRVTGSTG
jgi:hypothetical protein